VSNRGIWEREERLLTTINYGPGCRRVGRSTRRFACVVSCGNIAREDVFPSCLILIGYSCYFSVLIPGRRQQKEIREIGEKRCGKYEGKMRKQEGRVLLVWTVYHYIKVELMATIQ
jgi:hypothetical protein